MSGKLAGCTGSPPVALQQRLAELSTRRPVGPDELGRQWRTSSGGHVCGGEVMLGRFAIEDLEVVLPRRTTHTLALCHAADGTSWLTTENDRWSWRPRPGDLLLVPADVPLHVRHEGSVEMFLFSFVAHHAHRHPLLKSPAGVSGLPLLVGHDDEVLRSLMTALIEAGADRASTEHVLVGGVQQAVWAHLDACYGVRSAAPLQGLSRCQFERLERYVVERLDSSCSVAEAASRIGMTRPTFERALRAHSGRSFAGFVRELRLQRARQALLDSEDSITDVAYDHGFAGPSHFSREFSRRFGLAPSRLRSACAAVPLPAEAAAGCG